MKQNEPGTALRQNRNSFSTKIVIKYGNIISPHFYQIFIFWFIYKWTVLLKKFAYVNVFVNVQKKIIDFNLWISLKNWLLDVFIFFIFFLIFEFDVEDLWIIGTCFGVWCGVVWCAMVRKVFIEECNEK